MKRLNETNNLIADLEIWMGVVTASGPSTITISVSGFSNGNDLTAQEFTAGSGATWSVDTSGTTTTFASPFSFPSLTPTGQHELYYGFATDNGQSALSGGGTAGFTYVPSGLPVGDLIAYDTDTSTTVAPVARNSNTGFYQDAVGVLLTATPGAPSSPAAIGGVQLCNGGVDAAANFQSPYQSAPSLSAVNANPEFAGYNFTSVIDLPAGDNSPAIGNNYNIVGHTFYYFRPGVHYVGTFVLDQQDRVDHIAFYGGGTAANPAIITGAAAAFSHPEPHLAASGTERYVTFEYLQIKDYVSNVDADVMNVDGGANWTLKHDIIGPNSGIDANGNVVSYNAGGAGFGAGMNSVVQYNCFTKNGQYAVQAAGCGAGQPQIPGGGCKVTGIVIDHNEFDSNDYATLRENSGARTVGCLHCGFDNFPTPASARQYKLPNDCSVPGQPNGCNNGFSGGMKAWIWSGAQITNNWVHDNHAVGLWADTINVGITYSGNYIANNWGEGIVYEVSYNAQITGNTFVKNAWVWGASDPGFPYAAIYMSESGYDSRVTPNNGSGFSAISNNVFIDNWDGVTLWEASDRYCTRGNPTVQCTEPESGESPTQATLTTCQNPGTATGAAGELGPNKLLGDCRWQTKNIHVTNNIFRFTPSNINPLNQTPYASTNTCATSYCGYNSIISGNPSPAPYPGQTIEHSIVWDQGNLFANNTYSGPWKFDTNQVHQDPLLPITFSQWQAAQGSRPATNMITNSDHPPEDVGSTCSGC
ncbi:MAG: right-handed parallel beta-helix repeat-containing protein [Actinomycetota bacterium]|nr:right-handed parallel beta-helix repeat-containing protein [Actinomycetota bacterium]